MKFFVPTSSLWESASVAMRAKLYACSWKSYGASKASSPAVEAQVHCDNAVIGPTNPLNKKTIEAH
eukprot:scaffold30989_cov33-Prasinocladus_malaysianus.AAC.2